MDEDSIKKNILVIDDDDQILELIKRSLSKKYNVQLFRSAEEALYNFQKDEYDAVITDISLPGIDGIGFLKLMHEKDENLPVIVVTGLGELNVAISALKNRAFDYIQKPFSLKQIEISVDKAVEWRKLVRKNQILVNKLKEKNRKLTELNKEIQSRNNQLERDINIAKNLQECLYPVSRVDVPGYEISTKNLSIEKISGDFFLFEEIDDEKFLFIIGDVSGHGIPAALYSAIVKSSITSIDKKDINPSEALKKINYFLINAQKKISYNYLTICYLVFNKKEKRITYSNAGIPSPILFRKSGEILSLKQNGPFVGIFEDAEYRDDQIDLICGDKIIIFSDGAYESYNKKDILNAYNTITEIINKNIEKSVEEIIEKMYTSITSYKEKLIDDATFVGIEFKG